MSMSARHTSTPKGGFVPTVSELSESVLNSIIVVDFFKHL